MCDVTLARTFLPHRSVRPGIRFQAEQVGRLRQSGDVYSIYDLCKRLAYVVKCAVFTGPRARIPEPRVERLDPGGRSADPFPVRQGNPGQHRPRSRPRPPTTPPPTPSPATPTGQRSPYSDPAWPDRIGHGEGSEQNVTGVQVVWKSSNPQIATVNGGLGQIGNGRLRSPRRPPRLPTRSRIVAIPAILTGSLRRRNPL